MTPLSFQSCGTVVCVSIEGAGPEVTRLKRMGVCVGRRLEVVQAGDPMILRVAGTRIGLSRQLAGAVFVEPAGMNATLEAPADERESGEA